MLGQNLDCHVATQARVRGAIHFAHSARAEWREDLVRPKLCASKLSHKLSVYINWGRDLASGRADISRSAIGIIFICLLWLRHYRKRSSHPTFPARTFRCRDHRAGIPAPRALEKMRREKPRDCGSAVRAPFPAATATLSSDKLLLAQKC